jgi:hypothetical protein
MLLGAIAFALASRASKSDFTVRLLIGAALAIVASSTRDLLVAAVAIQLYALVFSRKGSVLVATLLALASLASVLLVAWRVGATDLAAVASAEVRGVLRLGLVSFTIAGAATWLAQSRRMLRSTGADLVLGVVSSFVLLVVVMTVLVRLQAWLPAAALGDTFPALALLALGLGAFGMLGATRISTFLTALLMGRAGASLFALLGGVHGRVPLLVELVVTGASLLLVALALELSDREGKPPFSLDDLAGHVSAPAGVLLLTGAFTAAALPPFPGFFARLASASAVLLSGHSATGAAMVGFTFLAGVGSMRLVARAWAPSADVSYSVPARGALVAGLGLVAAALWFLLVAPGSAIEWATKAASGIF